MIVYERTSSVFHLSGLVNLHCFQTRESFELNSQQLFEIQISFHKPYTFLFSSDIQ